MVPLLLYGGSLVSCSAHFRLTETCYNLRHCDDGLLLHYTAGLSSDSPHLHQKAKGVALQPPWLFGAEIMVSTPANLLAN